MTTNPTILLRSAVPTLGDGFAFAELLDQAQQGVFRVALGRKANEIVAQAFLERGHDLSYENVTFAERGEQIVGMGSGYTAEAHRHFSGEPLEAAAGWRRYRFAAFAMLGRRLLRFMETIPDGDFYVRALAVDPAHRGAGIGTRLIGSLESTARAAGSTRLALDVAGKNRDGRRLYERLGMTAEAESPKWFGLPNTNAIRMTKPL